MDHWWRTVTLIVMGVAAGALVLWDIVVAANNTSGDTISEIALNFVRTYPLAAFSLWFSLGVICGHLFWPQFIKTGQ